MRILYITLITIIISISHTYGFAQGSTSSGDIKMTNWSLGRINFTLSDSLKLTGRNHNIYFVDIKAKTLSDIDSSDYWKGKINSINNKISKSRLTNNLTSIILDSDFFVAFYNDKAIDSDIIKLEAQKSFDNTILEMSFEGKSGKEDEMLRGIKIITNSFEKSSPYGFNIGNGSITSTPGINEHTRATFKDDNNNIKLEISTQVATQYLNSHPLEDIEHEIKGFALDGITLKVLKNTERTVAGFNGYEGMITLETKDEIPEFRFTWFTPGVTADSFKPEIRIKATGPIENIEEFKMIWEIILNSLSIRKQS